MSFFKRMPKTHEEAMAHLKERGLVLKPMVWHVRRALAEMHRG